MIFSHVWKIGRNILCCQLGNSPRSSTFFVERGNFEIASWFFDDFENRLSMATLGLKWMNETPLVGISLNRHRTVTWSNRSEARVSSLSNPPQSRNSDGNKRDSMKTLAPRRKRTPAPRSSLPLWIAPKFQFVCVYSFKEYNFIAETRELMFTLGIVISWKIQSKYEQ